MAYCGKCLHLDVCKTADSCDGHVPKCKHFMDKEEHPKLKHGEWVQIGYDKAMDRITCSCRFTSYSAEGIRKVKFRFPRS